VENRLNSPTQGKKDPSSKKKKGIGHSFSPEMSTWEGLKSSKSPSDRRRGGKGGEGVGQGGLENEKQLITVVRSQLEKGAQRFITT